MEPKRLSGSGGAARLPEYYAEKLSDPNLDAKFKLQQASELRDSIEVFQATDYHRFLSKLVPVFLKILGEGQPIFVSTIPEQKLRVCILEIFHRLPLNDHYKEYAKDIMALLMQIIKTDNEDNAVLALKIMIDLHRHYKVVVADQVQPFLDFVFEMYGNMPNIVKEAFDTNTTIVAGSTPAATPAFSPKPNAGPDELEGTENAPKTLAKSITSFKTLTECPIIVVLLLQIHRNVIATNMPRLVPLIMDMLALQAGPQAEGHAAAAARGEILTGPAPGIRNKTLFGEFVVCQVKTMSLLAFLLRNPNDALKSFRQQIPEHVVRLLKDCPPELSAARKELLVATRHILSTDFRGAFLSKIDILSNEKVLVGGGITSHETLRPLAYSMLADLLHHVRAELDSNQLRRTIAIYSANLHDDSLAPSIQTMCAKLLLNLIDRIIKLPDLKDARTMLLSILETFKVKFEELNRSFPKQKEEDAMEEDTDIDMRELSERRPIKTLSHSAENPPDPVKDGRYLFRNLVSGFKTLLFGLRSCNHNPPPQFPNPVTWGECARVAKWEEVQLMIDLFRECAEGFMYWAVDRPKISTPKSGKTAWNAEHNIKLPVANSREEKESLDAFATFFMHIDPAVLHQIFYSEMDDFFDQIVRNPALLSILQTMLAGDVSTANTCTLLLDFLMKQLPTLGDDNGVREMLIISMFRLCFMSVTLFPDHNEGVLVPHLAELMTSCIKNGASAKFPANYYYVLQILFKNVGVGRFELLYKEVLPLMQTVLEALNSLLESARKQNERDLYAELCLTFPVRLSVLLPYLSYLMKPLVHALYGPNALVSQALRTLELCVDNLTSDFLDPILKPVISDLMTALRSHLKPTSAGGNVHAHLVIRILGKLGGRNRQYLSEPPTLKSDVAPENDPGILVEFGGYPGKEHFNHLKFVELALRTIREPKMSVEYKRQAFNFLRSALYAFVPNETVPDDFPQTLRECSDSMITEMPDHSQDKDKDGKAPASEERVITAAIFEHRAIKKTMVFPSSWPRRYGTDNFLDKILQGIFNAIVVDELKDEVRSLIFDFCQYFAVLEIAETNEDAINTSFEESGKTYRADGNILSPHVLVDALVDSLCSEHEEVVEFAAEAIQKFIEAAVIIVGSQGHIGRLSMFNMLAIRFRHYCYRREWYYKAGGCRGIEILCNNPHFDTSWLLHYELDFTKALLFIIKDVPPELSPRTNDSTRRVLNNLLAKCNSADVADDTPENNQRFANLLQHLVFELSDKSVGARDTVQAALRQLAELKGVDLHTLMQTPKDALLQRIWAKPLRTLHFHNQIASIDALNFCFGIQPPIIEQTQELTRYLQETVQTAEAEDDELIPQSRMSQHRNASALVELRIACLNLLSTVMSTPSFVQNNSPLRGTIISIFFKYLYWKNRDVINAASKGLRRLVSQNTKLPKELLQGGLKPILMNMADHKRLTVEGLDGLATLLELLNSYFKVEIGKKLLDHLKAFLEPVAELHELAKRSLYDYHSMKILKSILNVFHLLPHGANIFLIDLVGIVLELESILRRTHDSPFRTPLLKFLNRYPSDSWDHFGTKLGVGNFGRLYAQIIADPAAAPMRETIQKNREILLQRAFSAETENPTEQILAAVNGLYIIKALVQHNPKWITEDPEFVVGLLERTVELAEKGRNSPMEEDLLQVKQAVRAVVDVFITYLQQNPNDIRFFLDLTSAISSRYIELYPAYSDFVFQTIVASRSVDLRRQYLKEGLQLFSNRSAKQEFKTFVFRHIINPILILTYSREEKLVDKALLSSVNKDVWKPLVNEASHSQSAEEQLCKEDALKLEIIQMSTLLIIHSSSLAADHRKDIIRLAYGLIKMDDITIRYAAYVLIANFISKYDCPVKIPIQIYVALLRAHQSEAKHLVKQALDTLAPVLPQKLPTNLQHNSYKYWPRRILGDDSQNTAQMVNVFQFLVRQSDLFYEHRDLYTPHLINALPRLAFVQNANHETKSLAIDMVETIYKWETRRNEEMRAAERAEKAEEATKGGKTPNDHQLYTTPMMLREGTITFLIRFICLSPDPTSKQLIPLSRRTVELVRNLMSKDYWPEVNVKLSFFERTLANGDATEANAITFVPGLEVLKAILENQDASRIVQSASQLGNLLQKSLRSESASIQEALQPLLRVILSALGEQPADDSDSDANQIIGMMVQVAQDNFVNHTNLSTAITILEELLPSRPDVLDTVSTNLLKVFQRLVKDHISPPPQPAENHPPNVQAQPAAAGTAENATSHPAPLPPETVLSLLFRLIDILKSRLSRLGEHRRWFLSGLVQMIERSSSAELCRRMLGVAKEWTMNYQDSFPTTKEKTAVVIKMNSFEGRGDNNLVNDYLRLILEVYKNPEIQRTELTSRLEAAFMFGVRCEDYALRNRFLEVFSNSISTNIFSRLNYIISIQNWECNAQHYWINVALSLLMGSVVPDRKLQQTKSAFIFRRFNDMKKYIAWGQTEEQMQIDDDEEVIVEDSLVDLVSTCRRVMENARRITTGDLMEPLRQLQYLDDVEGHRLWVSLFASAWRILSRRDRSDLRQGMVPLLSQEYHNRQMEKRPNVVITLLEGIGRCSPTFKLPPHLIKYLGSSFNAWYVSLNILEEAALNGNEVSEAVKESNLDALVEMYSALGEEDMFYGLWRRRCVLLETNSAMSFEQNGMWDKAMQMYENAQVRARTGALPYSESEYHLWEDHWMRCSMKLQQWELLSEIANKENYSDLLLECAWRMSDWTNTDREMLENHVNSLMESPTPRRHVFASFIALQKQSTDFQKLVEEGTQLALKKWFSLPPIVTQAHTPLFALFQQYVELGEAREIFASLQTTTLQNLEAKSAELKTILQTWRERLPNIWEDIIMWSDLVSWRQLVFAQINRVYLPLIREAPGNAGGSSQTSAYAYRGYHETAWIINRFAHVARKHQLPDVCINQLTKIYTLPNIEIQEAFLKLREQAKCYYYNNSELHTGLEVISNTNLMYFVTQQKAEFYTLKGMFLDKLKQDEEANSAFATAVQIDLSLAKAWAEWGHYNDRKFKESNVDLTLACHAVGCYLQAASLFKSGKARKVLARVLWLMSLDDEQGTVAKAWAGFKGEVPVWYWITFVPQLLTSLSHREARNARDILVRIAKAYPQVNHFSRSGLQQALYFQLRTSREDYLTIRAQFANAQKREAAKSTPQQAPAVPPATVNGASASPAPAAPSPAQGTPKQEGQTPSESQPQGDSASNSQSTIPQQSSLMVDQSQQQGQPAAVASPAAGQAQQAQQQAPRKPWEYVEEILRTLRTAYPLLVVSMEGIVDSINTRFKCPWDEDSYRLIVALLNDGISYMGRLVPLPPTAKVNIKRFSDSRLPKAIKPAFEADFVFPEEGQELTLKTYVRNLRKWRDHFEEMLDQRPQKMYLEQFSPWLSDFQFQKFDEVEVPGQYLQHKDNNADFIKIDRILPVVDNVRGHGISYKRLTFRGHDGSLHPFAVQYPAARHCRREERIAQLLRMFNEVLARKKESRRRNLFFSLPAAFPLSPHIRMVEDDVSYISLHQVYEDFCNRSGVHKDEAIDFYVKSVEQAMTMRTDKDTKEWLNNVRMEIIQAIRQRIVPDTFLLDFFKRTFSTFPDLWLFRKQFTLQYATVAFQTYLLAINNRYPQKLFFSRAKGNIWNTELLPSLTPKVPTIINKDSVPFRYTPNIQTFIGEVGLEGLFSCAVMAVARCLSEPEFEMDQYLSIFIRDELITWYTTLHSPAPQDADLRNQVTTNVELVIRRLASLVKVPGGNLPANQTIIDHISQAVDPEKLAQMDLLWMPWI